MGRFWPLGALLEALLGRLGSLLACLGGLLGLSWGSQGCSEAILTPHGASRSHPETIFGASAPRRSQKGAPEGPGRHSRQRTFSHARIPAL
eukprot:2192583-Pyramimonas_sp.AAC.1